MLRGSGFSAVMGLRHCNGSNDAALGVVRCDSKDVGFTRLKAGDADVRISRVP